MYWPRARVTSTDRFGHTTLHGAPWSMKVKRPWSVRTIFSVVVKRRGPVERRSGASFGIEWRPSENVSITMSQSVMCTDCTMSSPVKIVHQGTDTVMRLACRKGRSVGVSPSITTLSSANWPVKSFTDRRPMCMGRRM